VRALNSTALLAAWEEGAAQPPIERGLTLLAAAWPETAAGQWAEIGIGERDRQLLRLREELFGSRFEATARCPECDERLELTFATQDVFLPPPAMPRAEDGLCIELSGYEVAYRLPTSGDLLAAQAGGRGALLERCIRTVRYGGRDADVTGLPEEIAQAVAAGMAQADPQAEVRIEMACPACFHRWSMPFDILSYLWGEIEDWARRLLLEVHLLASAYGWSERDIVAMSPRRRRMYLDMVDV
jgi:hypothetical protein